MTVIRRLVKWKMTFSKLNAMTRSKVDKDRLNTKTSNMVEQSECFCDQFEFEKQLAVDMNKSNLRPSLTFHRISPHF